MVVKLEISLQLILTFQLFRLRLGLDAFWFPLSHTHPHLVLLNISYVFSIFV